MITLLLPPTTIILHDAFDSEIVVLFFIPVTIRTSFNFNICYFHTKNNNKGDLEFGLWKAGKVIRLENDKARNYRKKLEYQQSMGLVTSPGGERCNTNNHDNNNNTSTSRNDTISNKKQGEEQNKNEAEEPGAAGSESDSGSEYSYFTESEEEGASDKAKETNEKSVFTQQDLVLIQRT
jgi:hypothetical protein